MLTESRCNILNRGRAADFRLAQRETLKRDVHTEARNVPTMASNSIEEQLDEELRESMRVLCDSLEEAPPSPMSEGPYPDELDESDAWSDTEAESSVSESALPESSPSHAEAEMGINPQAPEASEAAMSKKDPASVPGIDPEGMQPEAEPSHEAVVVPSHEQAVRNAVSIARGILSGCGVGGGATAGQLLLSTVILLTLTSPHPNSGLILYLNPDLTSNPFSTYT